MSAAGPARPFSGRPKWSGRAVACWALISLNSSWHWPASVSLLPASANQNAKQLIGTNVKALKNSTGKMYVEELLAGELKPEGQIIAVGPYMLPRPGADKTPVQKVSFVTKASADLGCGVGYYK